MDKLDAIAKTLFLGVEEYAGSPAKAAFLRAAYALEIAEYSAAKDWQFEQSFAPYANRLQEAGYKVEPSLLLEEGSLDAVFILATRFTEENKYLLARGWDALKPGGWLVIAQHNDLGAKRLDGLVKTLGGEIATVTKHHCRAIASRKTATLSPADWKNDMAALPVPETPLFAAPGMFSWRRVDDGSALLMDTIPAQLCGQGADIAAGWGYLSWQVLQRSPDAIISLYEAEKMALDMAVKNLAGHQTHFHWCDAARALPGVPASGFDWAVMNPPAHDLLWNAPEMTLAMFRQAHAALKKGASLWLVAGRQLAYEAPLEALFKTVKKHAENGLYKILEAKK